MAMSGKYGNGAMFPIVRRTSRDDVKCGELDGRAGNDLVLGEDKDTNDQEPREQASRSGSGHAQDESMHDAGQISAGMAPWNINNSEKTGATVGVAP